MNINLMMQSEEACKLGISTHVWELQLQVKQFAELKTDGGHQRYVKYRNARAK